MNWEELLQADREGRVAWPKCPECGVEVKAYEYEPPILVTSRACGHQFNVAVLRWTISNDRALPEGPAWLMLGRIDQALKADRRAVEAMSNATVSVLVDLQAFVAREARP